MRSREVQDQPCLVQLSAQRLMLVRFTKNPPDAAADTLTCIRSDGSTTTAGMPRQGILPHAAICFVVESRLGWPDAFFGAVARGGALEPKQKKRRERATKLKHAHQTEALVECLEVGQWGGTAEPTAFEKSLRVACRRRAVPVPVLPAEKLETLRTALREFGAAWRPLQPGQSIERTF